MQPDDETMQDPASAYASADALDATARMKRDQTPEAPAEEDQDPMSGYASADALRDTPSPGQEPA